MVPPALVELTSVVLTGAGMSAESGLKTFRDMDGLWENYDIKSKLQFIVRWDINKSIDACKLMFTKIQIKNPVC